jgi:hypothetical protein
MCYVTHFHILWLSLCLKIYKRMTANYHLKSKFTKSANKRKKLFFIKNSIWVSKNAEFHAKFESVEKNLKKCTNQKLLAKMWRKYGLFHFFSCSSNLFCLELFLVHFYNFYIRNQREILRFFKSFFIFFKFCFFSHISNSWKLWSQTRKKRLNKSKKVFSKCVLDFNFAPIKGSVFFIF